MGSTARAAYCIRVIAFGALGLAEIRQAWHCRPAWMGAHARATDGGGGHPPSVANAVSRATSARRTYHWSQVTATVPITTLSSHRISPPPSCSVAWPILRARYHVTTHRRSVSCMALPQPCPRDTCLHVVLSPSQQCTVQYPTRPCIRCASVCIQVTAGPTLLGITATRWQHHEKSGVRRTVHRV